MDPANKNQEHVYFGWKLSMEEEYKIMTTPVTSTQNTTIETDGNYLVPSKKST